jgi:recombination DNA repair RAD52 pathway protein
MPPDYDALKQAFRDKTYTLTNHASDRAVLREIDDLKP